ncbi:hypothetical protein [Nocardia sp. NPDC004260]
MAHHVHGQLGGHGFVDAGEELTELRRTVAAVQFADQRSFRSAFSVTHDRIDVSWQKGGSTVAAVHIPASVSTARILLR